MERDCLSCPRADEGVICPASYHKACADHRARMVAERAAILSRIKVRTEHVYPPIPVRDYDWSAIDDDSYDGAHDSATRHQIGYGRTEQAAINDLVQQISEQ